MRRQSEFRLSRQLPDLALSTPLAGGDNCPGNIVPAGTYTAAAPFTDSGNTSGGNNTVSEYGYYQSSYGPDHIYTFTLTSVGANPRIEVSTTAATYNVSAYIMNGLTYRRCPGGVENYFWWYPLAEAVDAPAGGSEIIGSAAMRQLPLNVPIHLFIDSPSNQAASNAGPYAVKMEDVTIANTIPPPAIGAELDVDGSGKSDFVIARNTGGGPGGQMTWFTRTGDDQFLRTQNWGVEGDKFVPADYDGDGRVDLAVWRPGPQGRFYIIASRTQSISVAAFGQTGDDPSVVADYTGDGAADLAVYRPGATPGAQSYWFYRALASSPAHFTKIPWGEHGDRPVPGNIDGWDRADFTVQRADGPFGRFFVRYSYGAQESFRFGLANDQLVPFPDQDWYAPLTRLALVRAEADGFLHWYIREPYSFTYSHSIWGVAATDIPAPGDYNGDGRTELAIWRPGSPGTFYTMAPETGTIKIRNWGQAGDVPVASFRNR